MFPKLKVIFFLIFFLIFICGGYCQKNKSISKDKFEYLKGGKFYWKYGHYRKKQKDGLWIVYHKLEKVCKGQYKNGEKVGLWKYYWNNNYVEINYDANCGNCLWEYHFTSYNNCDYSKVPVVEFFLNGEVEEEYWIKWIGSYNKLGQKEGMSYCFDEEVQGSGNYKNGSKSGQWTETNIKKKEEEMGEYVEGKKQGRWMQYFGLCGEDGNYVLISSWYSEYKDGKCVGRGHMSFMSK